MNNNYKNSDADNFNSPNTNFFNVSNSDNTPLTTEGSPNININFANEVDLDHFNNNDTNNDDNNNNNNNSNNNNDINNFNNFSNNDPWEDNMFYTANVPVSYTQSHIPSMNINNNSNNNQEFDVDGPEKNLIDSLMETTYSNNSTNNKSNDFDNSFNNNFNLNSDELDGITNSLNTSVNTYKDPTNLATVDMNYLANISNVSTTSPNPASAALLRDVSSGFRSEPFSPQSLGFSNDYNRLGTSISNTLGKSYGSQLGSSLNNLISPGSSTYDGFLDSPYGSYNDDSFKSPVNSPSFKGIGSPSNLGNHMNPKSTLSKESKLSRRRELHNAVERRRRDLIKEKIKELGSLIPPTLLYDCSKSKSSNKEVKANKNIILNKSVEYIAYLKEILLEQDKKLADLQNQVEQLDIDYQTDNFNTNEYSNENETINDDSTINDNNTEIVNNYNNNTSIKEMSLENSQNMKESLSAFTENMDIKPSYSRLKFMDFSEMQSEPVDFTKLSESLSKSNSVNNNANTNNFDNNNIQSNDNNDSTFPTVDDDFSKLLNNTDIKFDNNDFLNQLIVKDPGGKFEM